MTREREKREQKQRSQRGAIIDFYEKGGNKNKVLKPGLDWVVLPEKSETGLKSGFLSIENRVSVSC